jgi:ATP-dependent RNA helicase DeaD
MPRAILDLTKKYQTKPQMIKLEHKEMTVPKVEQFYYEVKSQAKPEVLSRLIDINDLKLSLVFCNTKRQVDDLVDNLKSRGYLADGLHGDLQQRQRDIVMSKFRKKEIEVLVATDVAARGIDVGDIEAVFNYDIPADDEYYVHRIGRTARAGKAGRAISFVTGREVYRIRQIQQFTKSRIIPQKVPSVNDMEEIKTGLVLEKITGIIEAGHLGEYSNMVEKLTREEYTSLEVASALLKIVMGDGKKEDKPKIKK